MSSDERLLERIRAGDLSAFDALYARYERPLYGFILNHLGDAAEAEDALHEALLSVLRDGGHGFTYGSFKSWLYTVARNGCLNRLRSRGRAERARRAVSVAQALVEEPPDAAARLESREAGAALSQAVARLPVPLSELYRLRTAGLSYEEMAEALALPLGTVKSRMHEMVRQLKKEMSTWTAR